MNALRVSMFEFKVNALRLKKPILCGLIKKIHTGAVLYDKSYYEILHIPDDATQSEIKEAYYKLSKIYHPDIKKDEGSLTMFRNITEAYDVLGNVRLRQEYDKREFGKGEEYDTSKEAFYSALYKDNVQWNRRAPDFERLLNKRTKLDQYLKDEYRDRFLEKKMGINRYYLDELRPLGEYGLERGFIVTMFCFAYLVFRYYEMKYKWC